MTLALLKGAVTLPSYHMRKWEFSRQQMISYVGFHLSFLRLILSSVRERAFSLHSFAKMTLDLLKEGVATSFSHVGKTTLFLSMEEVAASFPPFF